MPRKKTRHGFNGSKRIQSEMQATIAFACYDSDEVLKHGKGMNKNSQKAKILDLYMPSNCEDKVREDKVRMCYVDQFLKGANQFKGLFECKSEENESNVLTIPYELHRERDKPIFVGSQDGGITRALLTAKNLTNPQDISSETLYRHAKEVEANCKKALALCLNKDSPWKDWDGHYPSGKTWFDYIEWLRVEMHRVTNDCPTSDIIDVDLDEQPTEDADDEGVTQPTNPSRQSKKKRKKDDDTSSDYGEEDAMQDMIDEDEDDEAEVKKFANKIANNDDATEEVPENEFFKGFWAFALWGYIPPQGFEEYKCALITTVVDDSKKKALRTMEGLRQRLKSWKGGRQILHWTREGSHQEWL